MNLKTKKRTMAENGDTGEDSVLSVINNGQDLGPMVRLAFETREPESLLQQLRTIVKKKEVEIEDLGKVHYKEFIVAVDELRCIFFDRGAEKWGVK